MEYGRCLTMMTGEISFGVTRVYEKEMSMPDSKTSSKKRTPSRSSL